MLRKDIWKNPTFMDLTAEQRLMYLGLHNMADDAGRLVYCPEKVSTTLFSEDGRINIVATLYALIESGIVRMYVVERVVYLLLPDFERDQKVDRKTQSRLPAPIESGVV